METFRSYNRHTSCRRAYRQLFRDYGFVQREGVAQLIAGWSALPACRPCMQPPWLILMLMLSSVDEAADKRI